MNRFVPARYSETIQRLALGIEPLDALRGGRIAHPFEIALDGVPVPAPLGRGGRRRGVREPDDALERIPRHESCVHALVHKSATGSPIDVRFLDASRRYVPRRLRFPVPMAAAIEAVELSPAPVPARHRIRRPALFPGAAYDIHGTATGMRGRVLHDDDRPVRWVRVSARLATAAATLIGTAHGDDRGEFLLVLGRNPSSLGALGTDITVRVTVFGPATRPTADPPELERLDPLWDLPLETAPAPGAPDTVSPGTQPPPGYTRTVTRTVTLPLGRIVGDVAPFAL
jgi:hypothetical protein